MYIKTTKNSAGQAYHHLVESYREGGRTRQRTLLSLGKVDENRLDDLLSAIGKYRDVLSATEAAKSISVEKTFVLGPLLILDRLFEKLGLREILKKLSVGSTDLEKIIFTLVAARFVKPGSKLKVFEHWQRQFYPGLVENKMELHHIYRAIDTLAENKVKIETELYWKDKDLFNVSVDVILYDLTTLRFESVREDIGVLRRFGFSKEKRSDCTQVVLGLLVDKDGIPLGFEIYPGNTFEGSTVQDIARKMRGKFNVRRFIFVADRGLFSKDNLNCLRESVDEKGEVHKGEFIVGMKLGVFRNRASEFYDISKFKTINNDLSIYETTHEGDRCIVTWSRTRAERDRKTRDDILTKIRNKLAKKTTTAKTFVSNQNYQRYVTGLNKGEKPTINEQAIIDDAKKDGFFRVVTNISDLTTSDIIANYKNLWIVEDAFGEIKGNLKARPIFHWSDKRIIGHLTLCFIAYFCEAHLTKALREKLMTLENPAIDKKIIKPRPLTTVEAMKELVEIRAVPVEFRDQKIWIRTDIAGNAAKLFAAIGLKIPPKLLKTEKCAGTNKEPTPN